MYVISPSLLHITTPFYTIKVIGKVVFLFRTSICGDSFGACRPTLEG